LVRKLILGILAVGLASNGVFMLLLPEIWYHTIPTVEHTGPFNPHFVRDIGCAYLVSGLAVGWLGWNAAQAWPAGLMAGTFLALHGLVHIWDTAAGRADLAHLLVDTPLVLLPAVLVLWLSWPPHVAQG
jgi:hypothetical protein